MNVMIEWMNGNGNGNGNDENNHFGGRFFLFVTSTLTWFPSHSFIHHMAYEWKSEKKGRIWCWPDEEPIIR